MTLDEKVRVSRLDLRGLEGTVGGGVPGCRRHRCQRDGQCSPSQQHLVQESEQKNEKSDWISLGGANSRWQAPKPGAPTTLCAGKGRIKPLWEGSPGLLNVLGSGA